MFFWVYRCWPNPGLWKKKSIFAGLDEASPYEDTASPHTDKASLHADKASPHGVEATPARR